MFVAVDIGKTTTRVASSRDLKDIYRIEKFPTLRTLEEEKEAIKKTVAKVSDNEKTNLAVVGVPGIIDRNARSFYRVSIYPDLIGEPFSKLLSGCIETQNVLVENDCLLAGFSEALAGSGKEFDVVSYIGLGTGVGGVRIAFKEIDYSYYFSEPGHQIIVHGGRQDPFCGSKGCVQAYISGAVFEEIYKVKPEDCKDEKIWEDYSGYLFCALNNVISMWTPEVIILGGGLSNKFDFFYPGLINHFKNQFIFPIPEIRKSAFGDDAGIKGAILLMSKVTEKAV